MQQNYTLLIMLAMLTISVAAQDGGLDNSFGDDGFIQTDINGNTDVFFAFAEDTNNRVLVVGETQNDVDNTTMNYILAYESDGNLDNTFGSGGMVLEAGNANFLFSEIDIQSDNKIIITSYIGNQLKRFLPNGAIDTSYASNGTLTYLTTTERGAFTDIDSQDGLLIYGFESHNGFYRFFIKRFLLDGSLDLSYGIDGYRYFVSPITTNMLRPSMVVQENGNLVVWSRTIANPVNRLFRFLPNGSLDDSFGSSGIVEMPLDERSVCTIHSFDNQDLLIGSRYWDGDTDTEVKLTTKWKDNGTLDTSFADQGYLEDRSVVYIQGNQRFIADNSFVNFEGGSSLEFERYYLGGSLDASFDFQGGFSDLGSYQMSESNSQDLYLGGNTMWYDGPTDVLLLKLNSNPLSIQEFSLEVIELTPNPASNVLTVSNVRSEVPFQIFDMTGRKITDGSLEIGKTTIDIASFQSGMYILNVKNTSFQFIKL